MPIFYLIEFRLAKSKKKGTTGVPSRFWGQKFLKTGFSIMPIMDSVREDPPPRGNGSPCGNPRAARAARGFPQADRISGPGSRPGSMHVRGPGGVPHGLRALRCLDDERGLRHFSGGQRRDRGEVAVAPVFRNGMSWKSPSASMASGFSPFWTLNSNRYNLGPDQFSHGITWVGESRPQNPGQIASRPVTRNRSASTRPQNGSHV